MTCNSSNVGMSCACQFSLPVECSEISLNPYDVVGRAHNQVLTHLVSTEVFADMKSAYSKANSYLSGAYGFTAADFVPFETIAKDLRNAIDKGMEFLKEIISNSTVEKAAVIKAIQQAILTSQNAKTFQRRINNAIQLIAESEDLPQIEKAELFGMASVAYHSVMYWNRQDSINIFDQESQSRAGGPFWADISGFFVGFVGSLIYNNNAPGNTNPFANGVAVGGLASKAAKK